MWEGIEVRPGKLTLTEPSVFHLYTSYIKILLYCCKTANDVEMLSSKMFNVLCFTLMTALAASMYLPVEIREQIGCTLNVDNGKSFGLYGPLNVNVFDVDKYLINSMGLTLH